MYATTRILPRNREVRGHISSENFETNRKAFDFFCKSSVEEAIAFATDDTKEEFGVDIHVVKKEDKFREEPKNIYDVYIGPKEHS